MMKKRIEMKRIALILTAIFLAFNGFAQNSPSLPRKTQGSFIKPCKVNIR